MYLFADSKTSKLFVKKHRCSVYTTKQQGQVQNRKEEEKALQQNAIKIKLEKTRNKEIQDKCILTYKNPVVLCIVTDSNINCSLRKMMMMMTIIIIIIIILNRGC
jgi:hypothetical protein